MISNNVTVREVRHGDTAELARNMRACDLAEVRAGSVLGIAETVAESVAASSHCWAAEAEGALLCIFGAAPYEGHPERAAPWFLATDALAEHSLVLAVKSREYLERMLAKYPALDNYVYAENRNAIDWLEWLGFTIDEAECYGPHGELFHRFYMAKGDGVCAIQRQRSR